MKSAIGIGSLLQDGLGDTIRVSLTEDPEFELKPCRYVPPTHPPTQPSIQSSTSISTTHPPTHFNSYLAEEIGKKATLETAKAQAVPKYTETKRDFTAYGKRKGKEALPPTHPPTHPLTHPPTHPKQATSPCKTKARPSTSAASCTGTAPSSRRSLSRTSNTQTCSTLTSVGEPPTHLLLYVSTHQSSCFLFFFSIHPPTHPPTHPLTHSNRLQDCGGHAFQGHRHLRLHLPPVRLPPTHPPTHPSATFKPSFLPLSIKPLAHSSSFQPPQSPLSSYKQFNHPHTHLPTHPPTHPPSQSKQGGACSREQRSAYRSPSPAREWVGCSPPSCRSLLLPCSQCHCCLLSRRMPRPR